MFKTNGRVKSTSANTNNSNTKNKEFICTTCGKTKTVPNIEFGEAVVCVCGKEMIEKN